jgi:hypothetical protein
LKSRLQLRVSVDKPAHYNLGSARNSRTAGLAFLLTAVLAAALATAVIVGALIIGSVMALIFCGLLLLILIVGVIRLSFGRPGRRVD